MIRYACEKDIDRIEELLAQVDLVHHNGRPDIFKIGKKYSEEELKELLKDVTRPILVCTDEADTVMGYCFCMEQQYKEHSVMTDIRTLYIDDICVDKNHRGKGIAKALYNHTLDFAKSEYCYNITLNVWAGNESAIKFYESMGLKPQKTTLERIL